MKVVLRVVAFLLVLALLGWAGAEFMLVRQARKAAEEGRIGLGAASVLTDPTRIGARLEGVRLDAGPWQKLDLSEVALWVPPLAWNVPHASLPARAVLSGPTGSRVLTLAGGQVSARFSPFRGMAVTRADLRVQEAGLDGHALLADADLDLRLTTYGAIVPPAAEAAYRLEGSVRGLNLPLLARMLQIGEPSGARPGLAEIDGPATLWLSAVIGADGGRPGIVGATFEGLRIRIDGAEMRVWGQIARGASGKAEGELALDSTALRDFVLGLAHAGFLPVDYAQLTASALETVARDAATREGDTPRPVSSPNLIALREGGADPYIPPRPEGVTRIPLHIEDGRIAVGNLPLSALLERGRSTP